MHMESIVLRGINLREERAGGDEERPVLGLDKILPELGGDGLDRLAVDGGGEIIALCVFRRRGCGVSG
jgi:hypothetical protein